MTPPLYRWRGGLASDRANEREGQSGHGRQGENGRDQERIRGGGEREGEIIRTSRCNEKI